MSYNNNYQELISSFPSLRTQSKDVVCHDCGGISATKVQQLLSTLEGSTPTTIPKKIKSKTISPKKKISLRGKKMIRKRIPTATKQRKINMKKIRSARNTNHQGQSKNNKQKKIK